MGHIKLNVLVLGGTGFIGSAVVSKWATEEAKIKMLVHHNRNLPVANSAITMIHGDITSFNWSSLNVDPPEVIIHLARISGRNKPGRVMAGIQGYLANQRLIRWMKTLDYPPLVVYASGSLVYGSRGISSVDEDSSLDPISFQRDYILAEYPFLKAMKNDSIPVCIIRPPWVYGPGSWFREYYYERIKKDGFIPQYGEGGNLMSLIHIEDCASQINMIARNGQAGEIFNLVSGDPITHDKFCRVLAEVTGKKINKISDPDLLRKNGKAIYEALTFSIGLKSKHPIIQDFHGSYNNNLKKGLQQVVNDLKQLR